MKYHRKDIEHFFLQMDAEKLLEKMRVAYEEREAKARDNNLIACDACNGIGFVLEEEFNDGINDEVENHCEKCKGEGYVKL